MFLSELNSIVSFNENCFVIPSLMEEDLQYMGYNKAIMINPTPPKIIS